MSFKARREREAFCAISLLFEVEILRNSGCQSELGQISVMRRPVRGGLVPHRERELALTVTATGLFLIRSNWEVFYAWLVW